RHRASEACRIPHDGRHDPRQQRTEHQLAAGLWFCNFRPDTQWGKGRWQLCRSPLSFARLAHMSSFDQLEPIETASKDELAVLHLDGLKTTLRLAYDRVPHYRTKFDDAGCHPADLKQHADIAKFPFTTKDDLRQNYPFGMFAVSMQEIVRVH